DEKAERFRSYIQNPVLTDIKVSYEGFDVYDIEPSQVPDVLAERPVIIFGKWKGNASGKIKISGKSGKDDFSYVIDVSKSEPSKANNAIKYLWARQKIRIMDDFNNTGNDPKLIEQITGLGLKYNLLTNYTSFIAIDSVVRNKGGKQVSIKQPLPLPENVSDYAVGSNYMGAAGSSKCMRMSTSGKAFETKKDADDMENPSEKGILKIVEEMPTFIGGQPALETFIKTNLVYPGMAKTKGISGTVYVEFTVKTDGSVADVKVIRGIGAGCDEEAMRIVKLMSKKWKPGKENGKNASIKMTLPINFILK
ncbi:MAG TPA: energy transducer TonB, partial [Bacteroidales bacterium]|nr:energy transducer TonB [Bacteroidales bacterium]